MIGGALYVAAYEGAAVSNHMFEPPGEEREDYLVCVLLLGSGATAFRKHEEMVPIRVGHVFLAIRALPFSKCQTREKEKDILRARLPYNS